MYLGWRLAGLFGAWRVEKSKHGGTASGSAAAEKMTFVRGPTCGELAGLWGASGQMKLPRGKTKATNED